MFFIKIIFTVQKMYFEINLLQYFYSIIIVNVMRKNYEQ